MAPLFVLLVRTERDEASVIRRNVSRADASWELGLHRARNLRPPDCADITTVAVTDLTTATIRRREVLGGLIHEYEKAA